MSDQRLNDILREVLNRASLASLRGENMLSIEIPIDVDLEPELIENLRQRNLYAEPLVDESSNHYGIYLELDNCSPAVVVDEDTEEVDSSDSFPCGAICLSLTLISGVVAHQLFSVYYPQLFVILGY